jgi:peptidoglycan/xylan/chitin deacetylase (PgdA/CDA1 family)
MRTRSIHESGTTDAHVRDRRPESAGSDHARGSALLYHDVFIADPEESGFSGGGAGIYKLSIQRFEEHLAALARRFPGGPVVLHSDNPALTAMPFMLTFDDGGVSAVREIGDCLDRLHWRAHFFITTSRIGARGFLSRAQIRALRARGHAIGSHSVTHPLIMSALEERKIFAEWRDSLRELSDLLGEDVRLASVPGGYVSRRVEEAAANAGIRFLWTSEPSRRIRAVQGMQVLGRYIVQDKTSGITASSLAARASTAHIRQWAKWNGLKLLKNVSGPVYPLLRDRILDRRVRRHD